MIIYVCILTFFHLSWSGVWQEHNYVAQDQPLLLQLNDLAIYDAKYVIWHTYAWQTMYVVWLSWLDHMNPSLQHFIHVLIIYNGPCFLMILQIFWKTSKNQNILQSWHSLHPCPTSCLLGLDYPVIGSFLMLIQALLLGFWYRSLGIVVS